MDERSLAALLSICGATLLLSCLFGFVGLLPDFSNPAIVGESAHALAVIVLIGFSGILALAFGAGFLYRHLSRVR